MSADNPVAPAPVQIQLQIDEQTAHGMYVNMAMLNHNETEFVIDFIYVQPQAPKAVVRARVINSPKHMKRLLHALQDNVAKYEAQFGKIDVSGGTSTTAAAALPAAKTSKIERSKCKGAWFDSRSSGPRSK